MATTEKTYHSTRQGVFWYVSGCLVLSLFALNVVLTVNQYSLSRQISELRAQQEELELSCRGDLDSASSAYIKRRNESGETKRISIFERLDWFSRLGDAGESRDRNGYQTLLSRMKRDASPSQRETSTRNRNERHQRTTAERTQRANKKKPKHHGAHFVAFVDEDRMNRELAEGIVPSAGNFTSEGLNPRGRVYNIWKPEEFSNLDTFDYNSNTGKVTIQKAGLYLIYGQMMFHGPAARKSYGIHINDDLTPFVESLSFDDIHRRSRRHIRDPEAGSGTTDGTATGDERHSNATTAQASAGKSRQKRDYNSTYSQCNTLAVTYLHKNDLVFLKSLEVVRSVITRPYLTFWGMAKL